MNDDGRFYSYEEQLGFLQQAMEGNIAPWEGASVAATSQQEWGTLAVRQYQPPPPPHFPPNPWQFNPNPYIASCLDSQESEFRRFLEAERDRLKGRREEKP